eukprot:CAMPEP_0201125654 /NCGR_PEP_ID=MMETSP0850-20130426/22304_1 /ASSEMBLY_ACC=CAM_ASM_000622 /TAXON_ID=183588 /ORGANISM="Pseudo-nitzschia fraudulenta, Strain WWA7" /LENGTH=30 /DNA_ID= /DNA_START= /DNA_END= /DNA_ORIENTATION=
MAGLNLSIDFYSSDECVPLKEERKNNAIYQ